MKPLKKLTNTIPAAPTAGAAPQLPRERRTINEDSRAYARGKHAAPPAEDYSVGYGKPPIPHRFTKGRSGNPGGRPRGSKNTFGIPALAQQRLNDILLSEAYRTISVNDGNGRSRIPIAQAIVRSMAVKAAKGDTRAQRMFMDRIRSIEQENRKSYDEFARTAIEYKVEWEQELERCRRLGIDCPSPNPHPDQILIDPRSGLVRVLGPFTEKQQATWEKLRQRKKECDEAIADYQQMLKNEPELRTVIFAEMASEQQL